MKKLFLSAAVSLALMTSAALADDVFHLTVTVDGVTKSFQFSNAEDFINANKGSRLQQLFPNYSSTSAVSAQLDVRGLPATLTTMANSNTVVLNIPSIGINKTFTGTTRDNTIKSVEDFFKGNSTTLIQQVQKQLAKVSPVDLVAGNPNSIESLLVNQMFQAGSPVGLGAILPNGQKMDSAALQNQMLHGSENLFLFNPSIDAIDADHHDGFAARVPLGVSFGFDSHPGYRLDFQIPLSYSQIAGSKSYEAGFMADVQIPLTNQWFIYPQASYGIAGSEDLASLGQIGSGGVTSKYHFNLPDVHNVEFVLGDSVGYARSIALNIGKYEFDSNVSNPYTKNGLAAVVPVNTLFGGGSGNMSLEYSYTRYFGTDLFVQGYNDIALGYTLPSEKIFTGGMVALHYTSGSNYNEYGLQLHLQF